MKEQSYEAIGTDNKLPSKGKTTVAPEVLLSIARLTTLNVEGVSRMVSTMMVPELKLGDYIIAHAGFALHVVDEKDALESIELLKELAQAMPQEEQGR